MSCFVANCHSRYPKDQAEIHLFKVPNNDKMLRLWQKAIARPDKILTHKCKVCALHFSENMIDDKIVVNIHGKQEVFHKQARLKAGAIPSLCPSTSTITDPSKEKRSTPVTFNEINGTDRIYNDGPFTIKLHRYSNIRKYGRSLAMKTEVGKCIFPVDLNYDITKKENKNLTFISCLDNIKIEIKQEIDMKEEDESFAETKPKDCYDCFGINNVNMEIKEERDSKEDIE